MQSKTSSRGASKTRVKRSSCRGRSRRRPCAVARRGLDGGRCASSLSKRSSQIRRCVVIQSSVWSNASTSRWHGRNWASRRREMRPLRSSTLRCLETAGSDMAKGAASSLTVASPRASRLTMARRVGSARAAKAASSARRSVVMAVFNQRLINCQVNKVRVVSAPVPGSGRPRGMDNPLPPLPPRSPGCANWCGASTTNSSRAPRTTRAGRSPTCCRISARVPCS